jgi:hypothetical protein
MPPRKFGEGDPRLGPYLVDANGNSNLPQGVLPAYDWSFEPPLEALPGGTAVVPEFRAATIVDPTPWRWAELRMLPELKPDEKNFPLDPLKAGDAHMRKFDDRQTGGSARNWWAHYYNRNVTDYTTDVTKLTNNGFTSKYAGANETFEARDVRYFNWRFIMRNNVAATPPVAPTLESFSMTYRFEKQ